MTGRPWLSPGPPPGHQLGRVSARQRLRRRRLVVAGAVGAVLASAGIWGPTAGVLAVVAVLGVWASVAILRSVGTETWGRDVFKPRRDGRGTRDR